MSLNAGSARLRTVGDVTCGVYVRVSTAEQNCELQIRENQQYASRQGWQVIETDPDVASGSNDRRRAITQIMADARASKFSIVLVWKLDRFTPPGNVIRSIARTMRLGLGTVARTIEERSKNIRDQIDGARYTAAKAVLFINSKKEAPAFGGYTCVFKAYCGLLLNPSPSGRRNR